MKAIKRLLLIIGILLLIFVAAVVAVPIFFKDELVLTLKQEINQRVEGEVDFADVSLSWWSGFPMMDLTIQDLHIAGYKLDTAQADLLKAEEVHLSFDPIELWRNAEELRISAFTIDGADIYVDQRSPRSNYDIMKKSEARTSEETTAGQQMSFHLDRYDIKETSLTYIDHDGGQAMQIEEINHNGRVDYLSNGDVRWTGDLVTDGTTYKNGPAAYLREAALRYEGAIDITEDMTKYTMADNSVTLNALDLALDGVVQQVGHDYDVDMALKTGQPSFKSLLSLLPALYTADYKDMVADGRMSVVGTIKGRYAADGSSYPVYDINAEVVDGAFKMPDLPKGVKDVQLKAALKNTAKAWMPERVDVPTFALLFDDQPVTGRILLEDLSGAQRFDGALEGHVDLAMLASTYPLPSVEELSGKLDIDMTARGVVDQIVNEQYDNLALEGTLEGQAIHVKSTGQPTLDIPVIKAHLEDAGMELDRFEMVQGESSLSGSGRIHPIIPVPDATYTISADVKSPQFDLRPWMMTSDVAVSEAEEAEVSATMQLPKVALDIRAECGSLGYEDYDIRDLKVGLKGSLEDVRLERSTMLLNGDALEAEGRLRDVEGYMNQQRPLRGALTVRADRLDINKLMGTAAATEGSEAAASAETAYPVLPEDMEMDIQLSANQLLYDVYDLRQLRGAVIMKDQQLTVSDANAKTMGGTVGLKALYKHDGRNAPEFAFTPRTQGVRISEVIKKSETLGFMLPFLKFMDGELNTEMDLSGLLGDGYMPDLSSLTGKGLVETLHSTVKGSETINEIGQLLNMNELKEIAIEKSRNRFEVTNGKVFVKPFTQEVEDMTATIQGSHGLDGQMNYDMKLVVPTERLEKAGMPSSITKNLGAAAGKLSKLGIDIGDTESIALDISITGALTNPKVKVGVADVSTADAKELVKEVVNEVVEEAKDSVKTVAKQKALDALKESTGDTTSTSIGQVVKNEAKDRLGKDGKAILDSLGAGGILGDDSTGGILGGAGKDLLNDINPFKRKKKKKK